VFRASCGVGHDVMFGLGPKDAGQSNGILGPSHVSSSSLSHLEKDDDDWLHRRPSERSAAGEQKGGQQALGGGVGGPGAGGQTAMPPRNPFEDSRPLE
jgi:hypothetical protein